MNAHINPDDQESHYPDPPEQTQEQKILNCTHKWKDDYYGVICELCGLMVPDSCGWWIPLDDEDDEEDEEGYHFDQCTCETCIQNYPERYYLLALDEEDDDYYLQEEYDPDEDYPEEDDCS